MRNTRAWLAALAGLAAVVLIAAGVALFAGSSSDDGSRVQTRGTHPPSSTTTAPGTSVPAPTSTTEPAPTATERATAPPSPWQVSATSGLTNLAPVTMSATGLPPDTYYVGQCPAGVIPSITACVSSHVITVADGTLASTVRVLWWLPHDVDCGAKAGACVVGVFSPRTGVTLASYPISFDPARRPTITVTPTNALTDRQTVTVRGVNIGEGRVQIEECVPPRSPACISVELAVGPGGAFTTPMTVRRVIDWYSRSGPATSVCGVDGDCAMDVTFIPNGFESQRMWITAHRSVVLHFAPVPTTTSATPSAASG